MRIVNKRYNHTGLAAVNLLLNNYLVMFKYYMKGNCCKYREGGHDDLCHRFEYAWSDFKGMIKSLFVGWTFRDCRIEKEDDVH